MTKITISVVMVCFVLLFSGCGNDNTSSSSKADDSLKQPESVVSTAAVATGTSGAEPVASEPASGKNKTDENKKESNFLSKQDDAFQNDIAGYSLGISADKLKSKLDKDGYKITLPPDFSNNADQYGGCAETPVKDGRIYQYDGSYYFYTKDLEFYYTAENKNYAITAHSSKIKNKQGIKVGDPKSKMIKVYGKKYRQDNAFYEYKKNGIFLSFTIDPDSNEIERWYISTLPMDFNAP